MACLFLRMVKARYRPSPRPTIEPMVAWVVSLLAADCKVSRSDCWRLALLLVLSCYRIRWCELLVTVVFFGQCA